VQQNTKNAGSLAQVYSSRFSRLSFSTDAQKWCIVRPIATDHPLAYVSVCLSRGCAVQKRLNGSRSCRDGDFEDPSHIVLNGGPDAPTAREREMRKILSSIRTLRAFDAAFAKLLWPLV